LFNDIRKKGVWTHDVSDLPFQMDIDKHDLRIVDPMYSMTPMLCWICHKTTKDGADVREKVTDKYVGFSPMARVRFLYEQ